MIHIDLAQSERCWNLEAWAYGSCYFCGCCDKDKKKRYESRLRWLEEMLKQNDNFQLWDDDPDLRVLQETNIRINHRNFMRKIRYYKRKLKEMEKSMKSEEARDLIRQIGNIISRDESWSDEAKDAVKEAFAMATEALKNHEAQLLERAELLTNHSLVWLEDIDKSRIIPGIRQTPTSAMDPLYIGYYTEKGFVVVNLEEYKKRWRAWSHKPTEEQRKAESWNE